MTFGERMKFTSTGRKKVTTVRSVQTKVAKYSITDENFMDLDSDGDTYVLGEECLKVYDWNRLVNVSDWNPKDGSLYEKISQGQWTTIILSQGKCSSSSSISVFMLNIWTTTCCVPCSVR